MGRVGSSNVPWRPVCAASPSRYSWISRWPASAGSSRPWPSGRLRLTASGRSRAMPRATHVSSGARAPRPRSISLKRVRPMPTLAASVPRDQRRARRAARTTPPSVAAIAMASRRPAMAGPGRMARVVTREHPRCAAGFRSHRTFSGFTAGYATPRRGIGRTGTAGERAPGPPGGTPPPLCPAMSGFVRWERNAVADGCVTRRTRRGGPGGRVAIRDPADAARGPGRTRGEPRRARTDAARRRQGRRPAPEGSRPSAGADDPPRGTLGGTPSCRPASPPPCPSRRTSPSCPRRPAPPARPRRGPSGTRRPVGPR